MSDEPSTLGPWLTSCERGRIEELGSFASRLREIVAEADGRSVDPKALEQWANVLDLRCEYISEFAAQSAANGTTRVVLGAPTCLYGRDEQHDRPMPPVMVERPARTLENAASDVAVAAGSLYGLQSSECADVLAELADELLQAARSLREISEGMEEDGDEVEAERRAR